MKQYLHLLLSLLKIHPVHHQRHMRLQYFLPSEQHLRYMKNLSSLESHPAYKLLFSETAGFPYQNIIYFSLLYSVSKTGSHHSFLVFSPGTSTAIWLNQLSFAAPCQCFTSLGIVMTSPDEVQQLLFPTPDTILFRKYREESVHHIYQSDVYASCSCSPARM